MESSPLSWSSFILPTLILLLSAWLWRRYNKRKLYNLPPGPPRWPVIGNLFSLGARPYRDMHVMHERYGPIIFLKLGCVNLVSTNDPDIIREVFITQDETFASRPRSIAIELLCYNSMNLAMAPYGPHWKSIRRICLEHLLTTKRLQSFRSQRLEEAQFAVHHIWKQAQSDKKIQFRHCFTSFNMNCLTRMLIRRRYYVGEPTADLSHSNFAHVIHESFIMLGLFNIADYFPALRWLDLHGYEKKMRELRDRIDEFQTEILEEHREKMKHEQTGETIPNFVDILLALREDGNTQLTDTVIKAAVEDMLAAGTDTSTAAGEWVMTELLRNKEEMRKAQEELDRVVGKDRMVEETDLSMLPYLRCIVMEAARLRPIGPFVLPHTSVKDTKVAGYDIPANTQVLVNLCSYGLNPKVWGNDFPLDEFHPERHKQDQTRVELSNGPDLKHMLFGGGKRRCPGAPLGMTLVMLILARLLHSFDWSLSQDDAPPETLEMPGMTLAPIRPLLAFAAPRLPLSLYNLPASNQL